MRHFFYHKAMKQRDILFSRGAHMKIGYAKVSTEDQNLDCQINSKENINLVTQDILGLTKIEIDA